MWRFTKNTSRDYGPDLGVDYARYSDPPDLAADAALTEKVRDKVERIYLDVSMPVSSFVKNGFIFLQGEVPTEMIREEIDEAVRGLPEAIEVINHIKVVNLH